jgi:hypothetical protein
MAIAYKLFQVAIIELPKRNAKKNDEDESYTQAPRLVLEPITVVAKSDQDAAIKVAMKETIRMKDIDQERMEVIVRPF